MTGIIEFSTDTLNIEVSGINDNIPVDLVEVISTGQDVYVNVETSQGVLAVNGRAGFVTLNKSDVGLSNVENISITGVSGYLQGQINNIDVTSKLTGVSGYLQNQINNLDLNYASDLQLSQTGSTLQSQINNLYNSGFITGVDLSPYYLKSNPSGFITGVDLSQYLTGVDLSSYVTKVSGEFLDRPTVNGTGVLLSGEAAGTANFRYAPVTGIYNLLSNNRYSFDTLTGLVTGILPASPQKGDEIELYDGAGTWHINPLIVDNNGNYIEQKKDQLQCNVRHGLIKLIYTTQNNIGWRIYPMPIHNVPLFLPPSIAITGAALSGIIPFYIALTGISLLDQAQYPVDEWYWNLNTGDGYAVSGQTIAYTYLQTGLYDVTLSGSNAAGFDVDHRFINVFLPYVPTVSVTSNKLSGLAPFTGQLSAINTTQPSQYSPVDDWYWDFDGDQVFDFTGQNATVVYNQTGTYNPTAYAVNLGGTGSGFITINVIEPLVPIPAIATYTASGYAPLTIQFSGVNLQTPPEFSPVDHWYWNLSGDSAPEFDQRVISYTFNETGTYTFYLTATNSAGSGVASGIVTVLEVPPITTGADPYSDYVVLLMNFNT